MSVQVFMILQCLAIYVYFYELPFLLKTAVVQEM